MAVADSSLFWASKVRRCDRHTAGISGASFVLEVASTEVFKSVAVACGGEVDRSQLCSFQRRACTPPHLGKT